MLMIEKLERLSELGFLRYAKSNVTTAILLEYVEQFGLLEPGLAGRSFWLDAENLSEGGSIHALMELRGVLEVNGVMLGSTELKYEKDVDETVLLIDDQRYLLCSSVTTVDDTWREFSNGFFSIINAMLSSSGSSERLFAYKPYTNDQAGIFLTPHLVEKLRSLDADAGLKFIGRTF